MEEKVKETPPTEEEKKQKLRNQLLTGLQTSHANLLNYLDQIDGDTGCKMFCEMNLKQAFMWGYDFIRSAKFDLSTPPNDETKSDVSCETV